MGQRYCRIRSFRVTLQYFIKYIELINFHSHGFFLEDGIEIRNLLEHNLGFVTRYGTLLPTDRNSDYCKTIQSRDFNGNPTDTATCNALATYWVENPNNDLIGNVAAGSAHMAYWYIFPYQPTGPSKQAGIDLKVFPQTTPLGRFDNNVAHSNLGGLHFDDGVKTTEASASEPQEVFF